MLAQVHCKQWLQYPNVLYGTEVCGRAYFGICVRITISAVHTTDQQIPGLTGLCIKISRTVQVLEILQIQFQDYPGGMGTLDKILICFLLFFR